MTRGLALLLTLLTGFTGLVYEVTWQKSLATLLGSHAEATAAVLAIFLGGLSTGYALFGRVSGRLLARARQRGRSPRLFGVYGGVECAIGLWALAFPALFTAARSVSVWLPFQRDPAAFVADVGLSALLIGPPALLMGGTVPMLTQALARSLADATRFHALVYGFNTVGAFAGALAAAFLLVPALGLSGTLRTAGVLNLLAGIAFIALQPRAGPSQEAAPAAAEPSIAGARVLAAAALLLGFAMMTIQTVSIRVAGLAFGASPFTFAMVVAVFVLCIAIGSLAVSAWPRIPRIAVVLCPSLLALALLALYPYVDYAPWAAHRLRIAFRDEAFAFLPFQTAAFLGLLLVLAVPAGLSGAALPLLFHELRRSYGGLGSAAGRLYSWNTLGNLLGALLGGYLLLYWLDLHQVYRVAAAATVAASLLLAARLYDLGRVAPIVVGATSIIALALLPAWRPERMASGLFRFHTPRSGSFEGPDAVVSHAAKVIFYTDDPTTTVTVKEDRQRTRAIFTNGKPDSSLVGDYPTTALLALVPCLLARSCQDAFVVGYGSGVTVGELAALESMQRVVVAELSSGVLEAAPLFDHGNLQASRNPKVQMLRSDAYRALLRSEGHFDVIASEPPNPWVSGVEMLYSVEFLRAARERLSPGGVHVQWFHTYSMDAGTVALVLRTYAAVFDRVAVWFGKGPDLLILGLMPEAAPSLESIEARMRRPDFAAGLGRAGIDTLPQLLAHELLPLGVVNAMQLPGELHTLEHPHLSDRAVRAFFTGQSSGLPSSAGLPAAGIGERNSLLRAWMRREGRRVPRAAARELCRNGRPECLTALACWRFLEPDSAELRDEVEGLPMASSAAPIGALSKLFGPAPPGPVSAASALETTRFFASQYFPALPFDRESLHALWDRCTGARCGRARQRAARLLSGGLPDR